MASELLSSPGLLSKFQGCMIGALIGDSLGAPYQFAENHVCKSVLRKFMSKILSGESSHTFSYKNDIAMTLCVASSLINKGDLDPRDLAEEFVVEYVSQPKRSYSHNIVNVFRAWNDSDFEDVFLPARQQFNGSGSYGNGSAMRISPLALFGSLKGESYLKKAVKQESRLTHAHPLGYNGAILQALAVEAALNSDPQNELDPVDFIRQLQIKMMDIEKPKNDEFPYCNSLKKIKDIYLKKKEDISSEEIAAYLGNGVSALQSVPTAIYSFLRGMRPIVEFESSNPFVRTIYFAISVSGDTDTIATMAGSIAGAYYGVEGIPDVLQKRCEKIDEVGQLAEKLYNIAVKQAS